MENAKKKESVQGFLMVAAAGISWGTTGIIAKKMMNMGIESSQVAFLRMFLGFVCLLMFISIVDYRRLMIDAKGLLLSLIIGVAGHFGFNLVYFHSVDLIGVASATVLLYLAPLFLMIWSRVFFKEKVNLVKIAGVLICVTGSYFSIRGIHGGEQVQSTVGIFLGLMSALIYSMISVMSKVALKGYRADVIVLYSFMFGAAFSALFTPVKDLGSYMGDTKFILAAIGIGTLSSSVPYVLYFSGVAKGIELSKAGVISVLELIVSVFLSVVVIGEKLEPAKWMGILMIVIAIAVIQNSEKLYVRLCSKGKSDMQYESL